MFYRIDENNNIIDYANINYSPDCIETQKNIVRGFDGRLYFEEETKTDNYIQREQKYLEVINARETIEHLKKWFDVDYTRLEQKYRRLHTLLLLCDNGTTPYDMLIWLYKEAEVKRKRIQELEGLINE